MLNILAPIAGAVVSGLFSKSNASENRDFQADMSGTAHQREVKDLIAAGLNPMLSAKLGGASTPSGAVANTPDYASAISQGYQAKKIEAEIDKTKADTAVSQSQEVLNKIVAIKAEAEARNTVANAQLAEQEYERQQYLRQEWGLWGQQGHEVAYKQAKAVYDKAMVNRDYLTISGLDEHARQKGYKTFDEAIKNQDFRRSLQDYALRQLQFPQAIALSDFYKSPYGKEIAPYLSSAGGAGDLIGTAGGALSIGKKILGK